jgi:hypothetical protein
VSILQAVILVQDHDGKSMARDWRDAMKKEKQKMADVKIVITVKDKESKALDGVAVRLVDPAGTEIGPKTTDVGKPVSFVGMKANTKYSYIAEKQDYKTEKGDHSTTDSAQTQLNITMEKAPASAGGGNGPTNGDEKSVITGYVKDILGWPVKEKTLVKATRMDEVEDPTTKEKGWGPAGDPPLEAETNADGIYRIDNPPVGFYRVEVMLAGDPNNGDPKYEAEENARVYPKIVTIVNFEPSDQLQTLLSEDGFSAEPPVNIREAFEMVRLFRVGALLLAGLPAGLDTLCNVSEDPLDIGGLRIERMNEIPAGTRTKLDELSKRISETTTPLDAILISMRECFDLGTATAASVNSEFKDLYRKFIELASDDLNGVKPSAVRPNGGGVKDPKQHEEVLAYLRELKRALIALVNNMSYYGTMGTVRQADKWSGIAVQGMNVLRKVASGHVNTQDEDEKYPWALLSALTGASRDTVKAYVHQAHNGGELLDFVVRVYREITAEGNLTSEEEDYLERVFYKRMYRFKLKGKYDSRPTAAWLKTHASIAKQHMLPEWV